MTTTCIPQTPTIGATTAASVSDTGSASRASGTANIDRLRTVLAGMKLRRGGSERRLTRSTPSQSALESIESFPGLHR